MTDHPRFPTGMSTECQLAIADEVDITLAGFPTRRSLEVAITAYAEDLQMFTAADIRAGFKAARAKANDYAPTPPQVRACVGAACQQRLARERPPQPREDGAVVHVPPEFKTFLDETLGPRRRAPAPKNYVDGVAQPPATPALADLIPRVG